MAFHSIKRLDGLPFYKAIGFVQTDEEKTVNGIRFTPMKYEGK